MQPRVSRENLPDDKDREQSIAHTQQSQPASLGNFKINGMSNELKADIAKALEPATLGNFIINDMDDELEADIARAREPATLGNFKMNRMSDDLENDIARAQEPATLGNFKMNRMSDDLKADIAKASKPASNESARTTEALSTSTKIDYRSNRKPASQNFFKRHPWVRWALYGLAIGAIAAFIGVSLAFTLGGAAPVIALGAAIVGANLGASAAALVGASVIIASAGALLSSFLGIFKKAGSGKKNKAIRSSEATKASAFSQSKPLSPAVTPIADTKVISKRPTPKCFNLFARKKVTRRAHSTQPIEGTSFRL